MSSSQSIRWYFVLIVALAIGICSLASNAERKILIDRPLGDLKPDDKVSVAEPRPIQLLLEFQTDGVTNAKATKFALPIVTEELKASGVVGAISDLPVQGGDILSIVINDITEKGAASKGFTAGLTFGLAGVLVADNYDVKFSYSKGSDQPPISRSVHHRLYFKFGAKQIPDNAMEVKNINEGFKLMMHQVVAHGMNQIAGDPAFRPSPAAATANAPTPVPADASVATPAVVSTSAKP